MRGQTPTTHLRLRLPDGNVYICGLEAEKWLRHVGGFPHVGDTLSFPLQVSGTSTNALDTSTTYIPASLIVTAVDHLLDLNRLEQTAAPAGSTISVTLDQDALRQGTADMNGFHLHTALTVSGWHATGETLDR